MSQSSSASCSVIVSKYEAIVGYRSKKFFGSLMKVTKSTQVPQIIIDGEFVGNYDNLVEYLNHKSLTDIRGGQ